MENTEKECARGSVECDVLREPVTSECTVEHTLPDYMPEIRRIRRIDARVIPSGKYVGEGGVEFSGIVAYTVIYTDGEGELAAVSVNGDYGFTCPERTGVATAYADTEVESTACRLGGPRRISLRSTLRSRVHLCTVSEIADPDVAGSERLVRPTPVRHTLLLESGEIPIYDGISIPELAPEAVRPIFCDGSFEPTECRAAEGSVKLLGRANVRLVALGEGGRPMGFSVSIPVERELMGDGIASGDVCHAVGRPTSLSVRPSGNGEGGTRLEIDGAVECEVRIVKNREALPVVGLYSPSFRTETASRRVAFESVVGTGTASYTVSGGTSTAGEERAASVLDTVASATVRKIAEEDGRPVVLGDVKVGHLLTGTVSAEDVTTPCFSVEYTHPFRIEAPFVIPTGREVRYDCNVAVVRSSGRITEDGVADDTEIRLSLIAYTTEEIGVLESAVGHPEEAYEKDASILRAVYPDVGDSLWTLAERYHTTPTILAKGNGLVLNAPADAADPNLLDGVGYLLVE